MMNTDNGTIRPGELYTLRELKRRLGWGHHAIAEAKKRGLRLIPCGRQRLVFADDFLDYARRLAEEELT